MEHLTTRIWAAALSVLLFLVPAGAWALGLGNIEVSSTLNEPLQARIDLSALQSGDLDSMQVQLASAEQFRRAGIERPFQLSRLQFTTVADGSDAGHIAVTTRDPVVEPFLNFLVEVTWPRGRIVREYTVLLDPPVYGAAISTQARQELAEIQARALQEPSAPEPVPAPAPESAAPEPAPPPAVPVQPSTSRASAPPPAPAAAPEPEPEPRMAAAPAAEPMPAAKPEPAAEPAPAMTPPPAPMQTGAIPDAHDVQWGDTLWSLASRYRPDDSVSIQRMMLAMLSANPDAFNIPNINALRAGTVLRIPDVSEFGATDRQVILAEVERQNGLWQEYRQGLAASAGAAPEGTGVAAAEPQAQPAAESTGGAEPAASAASTESAQAESSTGTSQGGTEAQGAAEDGGRLALVSGGQSTEGVGSATTESTDQAVTAEQLAIAREEADAKTREAEELSSRVTDLEAIVERLERAIELRDDNIAELQQTLRDLEREADELRAAAEQARAEAAASGAIAEQSAATQPETPPETRVETQAEAAPEPMVETPPEPAAEAPPEPLVEMPAEPAMESVSEAGSEPMPSETQAETQAEAPPEPAAETPVEAASAVEGTPEAAPESVAASGAQEQAEPAKKKPKKKKRKKKPAVAPAPQPSFLESILESLPVDPVLLGAGVGGLLVVLGGAALWRRRRNAEDAEDMGELDLGDLDESDLLYDESGEPYLPDDAGEETAISELEGMDLSDEEAEPQVQRAAEEDPLEATHVAPPGAAGAAESEDDPLTEVNVYLAYERYDQAEELVRSAIAQYPDRHEYKLRLLEVFYAAKDLGSFESSARELQEAVGDDSPLMAEAQKMWQDMSPGRELFSEAESTVPEDQDVVFDVTGGDTETPATVPGSSLGGGDDSSSVDFDLGFDTEGTQTEAASGESSLDFDLGFDQAAGAEEARDESGLDLDLTSIGGEAAEAGAEAGGGSGVDFDLGDDASAGAASGSASMDFDLSGVDEPMGGAQGPSTETPLPERVSRDDDELDFDLEGLGEGTLIDSQVPPEAPAGAFAEGTAEGDDGALDFDLEGIGGESDDAGSGGLSGDAEFTALDLDLDAAEAGAGSRASGLDFDAGDDLTAVDDASSALGFDIGGDSVDAAAGGSPDDALDFGLDLDAGEGDVDVAGGADVTDETVKLDLDAALPGEDDEAEQDTVKLTSPEFEAADSAISDLGMDLDLDMGDADSGASSTGVDTAFEGIFGDDDAQAESAGEDDMALSLDGSDLIPPTPPPEPEASAEEFPEIDLDFDAEKSQDAAASDEYESTQFMLRDMPASDSDSAKSGASSEGHTLMLGGGLTGEVDEVQTKLDLAQAYIDMGDTDGAKGIIDEVISEGNAAQKNAAMGLLSKLTSS